MIFKRKINVYQSIIAKINKTETRKNGAIDKQSKNNFHEAFQQVFAEEIEDAARRL